MADTSPRKRRGIQSSSDVLVLSTWTSLGPTRRRINSLCSMPTIAVYNKNGRRPISSKGVGMSGAATLLLYAVGRHQIQWENRADSAHVDLARPLAHGLSPGRGAPQGRERLLPRRRRGAGACLLGRPPLRRFSSELSSVDGFGANIFVTGNLHTLDTTISGILLTSDDAGKTWSEPAKRVRAAELDQVQFADSQHGWASGVKS